MKVQILADQRTETELELGINSDNSLVFLDLQLNDSFISAYQVIPDEDFDYLINIHCGGLIYSCRYSKELMDSLKDLF
jgi:hypothetical protein